MPFRLYGVLLVPHFLSWTTGSEKKWSKFYKKSLFREKIVVVYARSVIEMLREEVPLSVFIQLPI